MTATRAACEARPRVEGPLKLTGAARYAADHRPDGVLHAVLVGAPVAAGCAVSTPRRRGSCPASRPS